MQHNLVPCNNGAWVITIYYKAAGLIVSCIAAWLMGENHFSKGMVNVEINASAWLHACIVMMIAWNIYIITACMHAWI